MANAPTEILPANAVLLEGVPQSITNITTAQINTLISQANTAATNGVSAINTANTNSITAISNAKNESLTAMEQKKNDCIAVIPADYSALSGQIVKLQELGFSVENGLVCQTYNV